MRKVDEEVDRNIYFFTVINNLLSILEMPLTGKDYINAVIMIISTWEVMVVMVPFFIFFYLGFFVMF